MRSTLTSKNDMWPRLILPTWCTKFHQNWMIFC